jgi:hypothetical protein
LRRGGALLLQPKEDSDEVGRVGHMVREASWASWRPREENKKEKKTCCLRIRAKWFRGLGRI